MVQRSSRMIAIGAAVFLAGAGLVFVGLRSGPSAPVAEAPDATASAPAETDPGARPVTVQGGTSTQAPVVAIPKGQEAVAVQLLQVPGLAGYAKPGDRINLYATVKGGTDVGRLEPPYAKLILSNVQVLDVTPGETATDPTFLLALAPKDAERVIFYAKFESLWAALVPGGAKPARTRGVDYQRAL